MTCPTYQTCGVPTYFLALLVGQKRVFANDCTHETERDPPDLNRVLAQTMTRFTCHLWAFPRGVCRGRLTIAFCPATDSRAPFLWWDSGDPVALQRFGGGRPPASPVIGSIALFVAELHSTVHGVGRRLCMWSKSCRDILCRQTSRMVLEGLLS